MTEHPAPRFSNALRDWGTDNFERSLLREIRGLGAGILPLHDATSQGGRIDDRELDVTVISSRDSGQVIQVRVGVFFGEVVGGCSCGDEPFTQPAYCLLLVTIEKQSANAGFEVIEESEQDGMSTYGGA